MFFNPFKIFSRQRPILIILRGGPASGKTTTGNILKEKLPNTVSIPVDVVISMLAKEGKWKEFWSCGHEAARGLVEFFFREGFNVVFEELLFETSYIEKVIRIGKKFRARIFVFELVAPVEELIKRKKKGGFKMRANEVKRLKKMVSAFPYKNAIKIDTLKKSPEGCANFILEIIKNGRK